MLWSSTPRVHENNAGNHPPNVIAATLAVGKRGLAFQPPHLDVVGGKRQQHRENTPWETSPRDERRLVFNANDEVWRRRTVHTL